MSNTINSRDIVSRMVNNWVFTNGECFFGYPQEVDEIHSKVLPLMIINPPEMTIAPADFNRNTILTNSSWTLTAYDKHDTSLNQITGSELILNGINWVGATGNIPPDDWTNGSVPALALGSEIIGTSIYKQTKAIPAGVSELGIYQQIVLEIGKTYRLKFTGLEGLSLVSGSNIKIGSTLGGDEYGVFSSLTLTDKEFDFIATGIDCYVSIVTSTEIGAFTELDTISIKLIESQLELLGEWDGLEDDVLKWFNNWWFEFVEVGNDFVLTAPIQITRLKEASNDRLIGLKVTFSFNFYRYCNP